MERTNLGFMVNHQLYWWDNTKESQSFRMHGREPQSFSEYFTKWCIDSNKSAWVSEVHLRTPRSAFISLWTPSLQPVQRDHLLWMNIPLNSVEQVLLNMVVRYYIIWTKLLPPINIWLSPNCSFFCTVKPRFAQKYWESYKLESLGL